MCESEERRTGGGEGTRELTLLGLDWLGRLDLVWAWITVYLAIFVLAMIFLVIITVDAMRLRYV